MVAAPVTTKQFEAAARSGAAITTARDDSLAGIATMVIGADQACERISGFYTYARGPQELAMSRRLMTLLRPNPILFSTCPERSDRRPHAVGIELFKLPPLCSSL